MARSTQRLFSASDLARWSGLTPQAINKAGRQGGLRAAKVGTLYNIAHPDAVRWLADRGIDASAVDPLTSEPGGEQPAEPPPRVREGEPRPERARAGERLEQELTLEDLGSMTMAELTDRFGSQRGVHGWIKSRKELAAARNQELLNEETEGRLINREAVATHVFGAIEACFRRLLGDFPRTCALRVYALARSNTPVEEAEVVIRELVASQLRPVKATAIRVLRGGQRTQEETREQVQNRS